MPVLQIYDPRERAVVAALDRVVTFTATLQRMFRGRRRRAKAPRRILLMRIERIGDLLMALPAIRDVRALAPHAEIDLVVGDWNKDLAQAIPFVTRVLTMNAGWLARGRDAQHLGSLIKTARSWKAHHYDLAINFEPDLRSNYFLAQSGAKWTVGYRSGGGGPLLDVALDYDQRAHTTANARRLVQAAFDDTAEPASVAPALLAIPPHVEEFARDVLGSAQRPIVGVHTSGGRDIKQWDPGRFAAVAQRLVRERNATIVLTGSSDDRRLVDHVKAQLPQERVIDLTGRADLIETAAILERLDLLVTGDTGPMHLAAAVGTPIVAVFGPSDPARYAPQGPLDCVVRIDLPCAPCNRIRLPPARCTGRIPDCLAGVDADRVYDAAAAALDAAVVPRRA